MKTVKKMKNRSSFYTFIQLVFLKMYNSDRLKSIDHIRVFKRLKFYYFTISFYFLLIIIVIIIQFLMETIASRDPDVQEASAGCLANIRKIALTARRSK